MFYKNFYPKSFYATGGKRSRAPVRAGGVPSTQSKVIGSNYGSRADWIDPVPSYQSKAFDNWERMKQRYPKNMKYNQFTKKIAIKKPGAIGKFKNKLVGGVLNHFAVPVALGAALYARDRKWGHKSNIKR